MRDTELYKQILGLENPWYVSRVELNVTEHSVDIWLEHDFGVHWECPQCGRAFTCRDPAHPSACPPGAQVALQQSLFLQVGSQNIP